MPSWSGFGSAKSNDGDRALQRNLARAALPYGKGAGRNLFHRTAILCQRLG